METLIEKKACLPPYNELVQCIKNIAQQSHPNKRPSYTVLCQKQFFSLGECVTKEQ